MENMLQSSDAGVTEGWILSGRGTETGKHQKLGGGVGRDHLRTGSTNRIDRDVQRQMYLEATYGGRTRIP